MNGKQRKMVMERNENGEQEEDKEQELHRRLTISLDLNTSMKRLKKQHACNSVFSV